MSTQIPDFEIMCPKCNGRGWMLDIEQDEGKSACDNCEGAGYTPTEIGVRILKLIRHNSRVNITADFHVFEHAAS